MKSLLPSFILILLYFIAEEFFGPKIGLIAVIVLGAGEFFYSWIKEKRINKMTLFNTLFFIALAAVSVFVADEGDTLWDAAKALSRFPPGP